MTTIGVASTALDFLATIGPDDQVWDDGAIEAFVEQVHALATQKRLARQQSGFQRAIAALRAEVDSLPGGDVEIDLASLETADLARLDPTMVLSRIEALTAAIAVYRESATTSADGNPRTIAERAAMYQAMGASLSLITECHDQLIKVIPALAQENLKGRVVHRRRRKATPVSRELWTVAYFLASCGHRVDDGPADPPLEFGEVGWGSVFVSFHHLLGAGRDQEQFRKSLSNLRDYYDYFVDSGRKGWNPATSPMPYLGQIVMADWENRPCKELWEYVKQFITR